MSARLLQRVLKEREREPDISISASTEEESDSPPATVPARNPFDLLDDQEDEEEGETSIDQTSNANTEHDAPQADKLSSVPAVTNHKSKKKKKKSKDKHAQVPKVPQDEKSLDSILEDLSLTPNPNPSKVSEAGHNNRGKLAASMSVLAVDPKHLKAENELRKIFGSKVVNSFQNQNPGSSSAGMRNMHGARRGVHNPRKTVLVTPMAYWPRWDGSLSMELIETKNGINYFRYVPSDSYRHAQEIFEAAKAANDLNSIARVLQHYPYHLDSLLTFADLYRYSGEHQASADAVAKCLFALECAFHPLFSPLNINSGTNRQLKYTHDINKTLFKALFSHMRAMDRRGCHRSALEVCKFLLSLDSDDPMGSLFCIDYFALRAQEYTWLERFIEEYNCDTSLWLFPNFTYSLPIARFYIERDGKDLEASSDKASALELMKQALMLHPLVLDKIVSKAPLKDAVWAQILRNVFFGSAKAGGPTLEHLINIYVERSYIMWRFPELQNLLKQAALEVVEIVKGGGTEARDWVCVRKEAFSSDKNEYSHLMVSDFSDTVPTLPPEELRPFMLGPEMAAGVPEGMIEEGDVIPERLRVPRDVAGRNPAIVFLESLLPWVDYGVVDRDGNDDDFDHDGEGGNDVDN
ncbi:Transcription factor 25 [Rhynchospora pubera]|uniref:Transcription factor 25 n=1 Tax=Rhynchospora pubera TaxID=906938 RepID=A0AAV8F4M3_9POAL|nr:Transcription factor 25 [Rhynchospora pubera]